MTLREDLVRVLGEWEVFRAGDGYNSIRRKEDRTPEEIADEILALPGFYTEYGWDNGWDPPALLGRVVTSDDREYVKKNGLRVVRRTSFAGPWEEVRDAE